MDIQTVWAAYWTTLETCSVGIRVRFRFPMNFGMLRAAEQAAGEMAELAAWLRAGKLAEAEQLSEERLQWMMPWRDGKRKVMNHEGDMELTLGAKQMQIQMAMSFHGRSAEELAEELEDAAEDICWWMKEKAYSLRLQ